MAENKRLLSLDALRGSGMIFIMWLFGLALLCSCSDGFTRLNRQAAEEYLQPIRPGYEGRNPFWNEFARKFTYAPAFDFPEVEEAENYRFTLTQDTTWAYIWNSPRHEHPDFGESLPENLLKWSFTAEAPTASLAPIWNEIPVGYTRLHVEAIDRYGRVLATVGERIFLRDFPFEGPYPTAVRGYRDAALRAFHYTHNLKSTQAWLEQDEPDMEYKLNTYLCKVIGATVSMEAQYAMLVPQVRDEALAIARKAADFIISASQPEGSPLEHFPPTYYKGLVASAFKENQGTTMAMEPIYAATGFLDLFDACGDSLYFRQALRITDTYRKIQREDGSVPVKLYIETGEPQSNSGAMLHKLLGHIRRLEEQYGINEYGEMKVKAEKWMDEIAVERFDMTGQFEDVSVLGLKPYQNLTNCTAAPYASYLLSGASPDKMDIETAEDLIRLSEDQFVHWNILPDKNGFQYVHTPCVYEQYKYRMPVDNSTCNVANAYIDHYLLTGDRLSFEKARALADALANVQNAMDGRIQTTWDMKSNSKDIWVNCTYSSCILLLRMSELTNE